MPPIAASAAIVVQSPSAEPEAQLQPRAPNPVREAWRAQMLRRRESSLAASTPPALSSPVAPAPRKPQPKRRPVPANKRAGALQARVRAKNAGAQGNGLAGMRRVQGRMWKVVKKEYACLCCRRSPA